METKELKCTSCGATIKPTGMEQYYECPNCGAILNINEAQQSEEFEERKKSGKITSLIAAIGIAAGLTITGALVFEAKFDHLHKYCPLNHLFGVEHQIDIINLNYQYAGIRAYTSENGKLTIYSDTKTILDPEGRKIHYAPSGFWLNGSEAYKIIDTTDVTGEIIYITQGQVTISEGATRVGRSNLGVYNPEIIGTIEDPMAKTLTR